MVRVQASELLLEEITALCIVGCPCRRDTEFAGSLGCSLRASVPSHATCSLGVSSSTSFSLQTCSSAMSAFRSLAPRAGFAFHSKQLQQKWVLFPIRSASSIPPPKPRVLEKPDKFRPPSHPARIRAKPRYTGPPLSENERQAQKTRRYPHMMPPEGTFFHWFLTNRTIHLWITLVRIVCDILIDPIC